MWPPARRQPRQEKLGQNVHQISDEAKQQISDEARAQSCTYSACIWDGFQGFDTVGLLISWGGMPGFFIGWLRPYVPDIFAAGSLKGDLKVT